MAATRSWEAGAVVFCDFAEQPKGEVETARPGVRHENGYAVRSTDGMSSFRFTRGGASQLIAWKIKLRLQLQIVERTTSCLLCPNFAGILFMADLDLLRRPV